MINKVTLLGHIGNKPEYKKTGEVAYTSFQVATSEFYFDKRSNEKKQTTEWHRCCVFGQLAETVHQYLDKGSKVYIEGKIKYSEYLTKENSKAYSTTIVASTVKFLDAPKDKKDKKESGQDPQEVYNSDYGFDDIPF